MAKVYFYDFSGYNGNFESLCSLLPSENKEKAANIKDELKKKQFVFSRFLLRYALSKNGYTDDEITFGKNGKPYFKGGYPFFSISHSDSAVCVSLSENELGVDVTVNYTYTGAFEATPEAQSTATGWYTTGTEVIFACGGAVGNSVMAAAEASNGKVIGVDVDQSSESATVITSAMKMLSNSVYDAITAAYDGTFPGGQTTVFDITNDGVGIAMDTAQFNSFTTDDYKAIYDKLVAGEITINNDVEADTSALGLTKVSVNVIQ